MSSCERRQQHLLAFLYDLLEPGEREETAAHLESCPMCREALDFARLQQATFAEAVKEVHADVTFHAPVKVAAHSSQPTLALTPRRRPLFLNRWAVAASLLFVLCSACGALGWSAWRHRIEEVETVETRLAKTREELKKSEQDLEEKKGHAQQEILQIQKQIDTLFIDWQDEESKRRKVHKEVGQLKISGPLVAQAGAKNTYTAELGNYGSNSANLPGVTAKSYTAPSAQTLDGPQAAVQMPVQARIYNQTTNKTVYEKQLNLQDNKPVQFDLPQDLQMKPGDDLAIEFLTRSEDGKPLLLRDSLKVVFLEYVTHLTTDRPLYRPGETVFFRSLTLERFSLKPAQETFHLLYRILDPNNVEIFKQESKSQLVTGNDQTPLLGPDGQPVRGVGAGEFALPANLPAGPYRLIVSEANERFRAETRTFRVHPRQTARLNKELQFNRTSYGAGDQVKANVRIVPLQGMRGGIALTARFFVDGVEIGTPQKLATDNEGRATVECLLPPQILRGVGAVTIDCDDGGFRETLVHAIPLVVRDLNVEFFPEGGELVAGVPNRVYFQVRTMAGKPADLQGWLLDGKGEQIARVQTLTDEKEPGINQGLGSFTFTPQPKRVYKLKIDSPIGMEREPALPAVKNKGIVLHLRQDVAENEIPLTLYDIGNRRDLLVGAYCRGRLVAHAFVVGDPFKPISVTLKPQVNVGGVYRITVFEKATENPKTKEESVTFRPLAERLLYRKNSDKLEVEVTSDKKAYQPRERVELSLKAKDQKRQWVPALALVSVVDQSVLKSADEKNRCGMPTHFLLTTEIRNPEDLENADVLLSGSPQAAHALDLLLGCQGWRRFAEQDPKEFQRREQKARMPGFLANTAMVPQFFDSEQKQIEKLDREYVSKAIDLQKKLAQKEASATGPPPLQEKVQLLTATLLSIDSERQQAEAQVREIQAILIQFGLGTALLLLLLLGFFLVGVGLNRLSDGGTGRPWFTLGFGLLGFLFFGSIVGTYLLMGTSWNVEFVDANNFGKFAAKPMPAPMIEKKAAVAPPPPAVWAEEEIKDEPEIPLAKAERNKTNDDQALQDAVGGGAKDQVVVLARQPDGPGIVFDPFQFEGEEKNASDRLLRIQGNYQALLQKKLGRRVQLPPAHDPCVVREYAHACKPDPQPNEYDFSETVYWNPVLILPDGKAKIHFDLTDAVTRHEVLVLSHSLDGRLGTNRFEIAVQLPIALTVKGPPEICDKDELAIPVTVADALATETSVTLSARRKGLQGWDHLPENDERGFVLKPKQIRREFFHVKPSIAEGGASLRLTGKTQRNNETVEQRFEVVPDGYPVTGSISGILDKNAKELQIALPAEWLAGTLQLQAHFFPSPLAELQGALEAIAKGPRASFEQNSVSNFANVLTLEYLVRKKLTSPVLEKRARQLLASGYRKMKEYECLDPANPSGKGGYDEFKKSDQPQEALTAYGLLQLNEMAKVATVEPDLLKRNEKYLLDRRDSAGGFKRNPQAPLPAGRVPDAIANAYIVWALTESGVADNLDAELAALHAQCRDLKDPYFTALVGLAHLNRKKTAQGIELLRSVAKHQQIDGRVSGAETSVTGSSGRDLEVETTSLAILGWLQANRPDEFEPNLKSALSWLGQRRRGSGSFGSTQATFLALKALVAHAQKFPNPLQGGEVQMLVRPAEGQELALNQKRKFEQLEGKLPESQRAQFSPRAQETFTLSLRDPEVLRPGKNAIQLSVTNDNALPFTLTWSYRTRQAANDPKAPVRLTTKLSRERAKEGETVKLSASVANVSGKAQGTTIAVLGLPAGLTLPEKTAQLDDLARSGNNDAKPGKIGAWELRGRELILYWRDLAPDAKFDVDLDLLCRYPGQFRGPASRTYCQYDADRKFWTEPLNIRIMEAK